MKKISILFFILFFNICSTSENGVISISENTTTTQIINEEDYPLVLAKCLNEEKGYQIMTPFDLEDLKTTINQLSQSKEDELELGEAIDFCIDKYSLWTDRSTLNQKAMYGLITREERVEENRKWLKETIEKEVYDQIKFVMPKESGGVYVPNK